MLPKIKKILYATSLGPGAPYVFRYTLSLAHACQAKICVVNAMEPLSSFGQSLVELYISRHRSELLHEEACRTVKNDLVGRAEKLIAKESDSIPERAAIIGEIAVIEGPAAEVILKKSEETGADMIVMGCRRHTVFEKAVLGSTARRVSRAATVPTCLVGIPEGYQEQWL